ncbi:MAG: flagellar motor switch protein FliN [Rickettsiales bacterium]|nr:flagellar motor switch protein FliN [Rickettsiales bacterium]|tara:strand:+ start:2930 stop:3331 length:402 start_codon:yes stop_codon:yes gene_type:complete
MNAEIAENGNNENLKETKKSENTQAEQTASKTPEASNTKPKIDPNSAAVNNLRVLENIEVRLTVEVGNTEIKIKDLLRLNEGSVVELDRLAGEPLDILANGTKIAKGEVVMVGERFGIRFTEVSDPEEMVQNL